MQLMAYEANAYIVTEYYDYLQAYRSDRYTGFVPQPDPDGAILFQYGIFSYMNIQSPSDANANGADATESSGSGSDSESSSSASNSESSDSGSSMAPVVWGLAAVVVIGAVAGWFLTRRRRGTSADVE
jgi:peptide/nickel transport system substrate-binding protein